MDLQLVSKNLGFANYADQINEQLFDKINMSYDELDIADAQVHHEFQQKTPVDDIVDILVAKHEKENEVDIWQ